MNRKQFFYPPCTRSSSVGMLSGCAPAKKEPSLMEIYSILKNKQFMDLTHAFHPGILHWPGFPDERRTTLYWYEEGVGTLVSGFFAEEFCHVGQWGTHVDPPAHFIKGLRAVDSIDVKEMIMPLVVIDSALYQLSRLPSQVFPGLFR